MMDTYTKKMIKYYAIVLVLIGMLLVVVLHFDQKWKQDCAAQGGHPYGSQKICVDDSNRIIE